MVLRNIQSPSLMPGEVMSLKLATAVTSMPAVALALGLKAMSYSGNCARANHRFEGLPRSCASRFSARKVRRRCNRAYHSNDVVRKTGDPFTSKQNHL